MELTIARNLFLNELSLGDLVLLFLSVAGGFFFSYRFVPFVVDAVLLMAFQGTVFSLPHTVSAYLVLELSV